MKPVGTTADRLRRMLAILTWLAQVGEAPIDDIAARFDLTPDALVAELELAACCGVPPYTPDQLMEIVVTETTVSAHLGSALSRPRRLSPDEGFALAASARALLAVPGSDEGGALSRALVKLETALGGERLVIELDAPAMLAPVRDALASGSRLEISYYSASSDRHSEREIVPVRVFAAEGHWYVDAACIPAGDIKRFRIDRIDKVRTVGHLPGGPGLGDDPAGSRAPEVRMEDTPPNGFEAFVPGPDTRRVRLSLDRATAGMMDSISTVAPGEMVGDRMEVEVVVGGDAWLERLLLGLGPGAMVVDPAEDVGVAAKAATRILLRYGVIPKNM